MELQFSSEELHFLADLLEQRQRELRDEIAHTDDHNFRRRLLDNQGRLDVVSHQINSRNLEFDGDQLDLIADVLQHFERSFIVEIARTDHRDFRRLLQKKQQLLERVHDRVTETCAPF